MAVNVNETEAKYDAPAGAALPRLDELPQVAGTSGPDEEQLEAEYYDTDDLRLVRADTRGEPLRPVARMTTRRQRLILLGPGGESLAEVAADDVSAQTLGVTTTVSSWHEVEVELTGGDRELLEAADELLRHDGLRPAERSAKLE